VGPTIDIAYGYTYYIFYLDWMVVLSILSSAFFLGGAIATLFKSYSYLIAPAVILMILIFAYPSESMGVRRYIDWDPWGNTIDSAPNHADTFTISPMDSLPN
jgi:hypothetical protein